MSRESLRFEEIQIRRAPGFERDGFTLPHLSAGINVIHGPNGAGKSTTARAVTWLLWPELEGAGRASLRARFRMGGAEWGVDVDGSRVQYQCDGEATSAPSLPPAEGHQRYHLSLHDLLRVRDEGFAAAVARESAGGFDVRRSGAVLDPRAPLSRRNALNERLDRARAEYEQAVARHRELRTQEQELAGLRDEFAAAEEARRRVAVLQAALDHAIARDKEASARAELSRFDAAMERVTGEEYDRLCRLRKRIAEIETARSEAGRILEEARASEAKLALPDEALRDELLAGLEADLKRLEAAETEAARARSALAKAIANRGIEDGRLGGSVETERLAAADVGTIGDITAFARRAQALAARRREVEAQLRLVPEVSVEGEPGRVSEGVRLLRCWLREPVPPAPQSAADGRGGAAGIAAGVLLVVLGVGLAVTDNPLWLALAVVGGALLWPMLRRRPSETAAADGREVHRREFEKLRLERPDAWEPVAVEALLENLQERADAAREAAAHQRRRRELEEELTAVSEEQEGVDAERAGIATRLGIQAETEITDLAWIVDALSRWQRAHAEVISEEAAVGKAEARAAELADSLRARLERLGYPPPVTTGEIAGTIREFRDHRQALQAARSSLESANSALRRLGRESEAQEEEVQQLFGALGLEPNSDETVQSWCDERSAYRRALETHRKAASLLADAHARLVGRGAEEELESLPQDEAEIQLAAELDRAARRDDLARTIAEIDTVIKQAKRSHSVEEALERVDRAEDALRRAREKEERAAIAFELVEALERATREQQMPAVFFRARELFTRITHGRYELRLQREGEPEFTAFDRIDRQGRQLDELSSGTRVQLLLAVRIAFVEQQEQGLMLPLLLDEVLGNSDDERARAVMEAAVGLGSEGRQIFYFTAQADEVARWRALAAEGAMGVELQEIDLQQVRGLERRLEIPPLAPAARRLPPAPEGADYEAYGRILGVPRLDRATARAAEVHLWYLAEKPDELHRLLTLGTDRWGPLQALVRDGGRPLVDGRLLAELEMAGRACEAFLDSARVGVGRPVDRSVLQASDAVTATFLDRVDELARRLGRDGIRLMEALESGEVARFTQKSKDGLREYLETEGYLPQHAPLELEEIRRQVLSRMASEVSGGAFGIARLDRLVERLWVGVGGVRVRPASELRVAR